MARKILAGSSIVVIMCWPTGRLVAAPAVDPVLAATCTKVLAGEPAGGAQSSAEPADGRPVTAGQSLSVLLTWRAEDFAGPAVDRVVHCVTIDGELAPQLSATERDVANDGRFERTFTVPDGLADGSQLCDRGLISSYELVQAFSRGSDPRERGERERLTQATSNDVCWTVAASKPVEAAAPSPAIPPSSAPVEEPRHPQEFEDLSVPPAPAPAVFPAEAAEPPPAAVPEPAVSLPRTGGATHFLSMLAGIHLFLGGLALIASTHRRPPALPQRRSGAQGQHSRS
jgi:LPXTG-motif cell wall-anchored protein